MCWDRDRYYTRTFRRSGKRIRQYIGGGVKGEQAAAADARRRAEHAAVKEAARSERERHATAAQPLDRLCQVTNLLMAATLTNLGFHQHDRGAWRRKRNAHNEDLPTRTQAAYRTSDVG